MGQLLLIFRFVLESKGSLPKARTTAVCPWSLKEPDTKSNPGMEISQCRIEDVVLRDVSPEKMK